MKARSFTCLVWTKSNFFRHFIYTLMMTWLKHEVVCEIVSSACRFSLISTFLSFLLRPHLGPKHKQNYNYNSLYFLFLDTTKALKTANFSLNIFLQGCMIQCFRAQFCKQPDLILLCFGSVVFLPTVKKVMIVRVV